MEILRDGRPVDVRGPKSRALLAVLLLHPNETVSKDRLIDLLWGETPPGGAANTLQVYVSQLRKALEPDRARGKGARILVTRPAGYELSVGPGERDVDRFHDLVAAGRRALSEGDAPTAARNLRAALSLWRGPALADFAFDDFARAPITALEETRLAALEERIEADLLLGHHHEVVAELAALVSEQPLREGLRRQHIIALYRCGRQAEALAAYREASEALRDELGLDPTPGLAELESAILQQTAAMAAPISDEPRPQARIPAPPTNLVGRSVELERVLSLLGDAAVRLVTLTGPGGAGKTRLAIEVASRAGELFGPNVHFVPLAGITDPSLVPGALANAVGVDAGGDEGLIEGLAARLGSRPALLVLDNFEHVLGASADLSRLLSLASGPKVLATSQAALRIAAEHEIGLPPLELPDPDHSDDAATLAEVESVQLFLQRAEAVAGQAPDDLVSVASICRRLDGLPLAIELAAARTNVLTPRDILTRLERPLGFLTRGASDAPQRHQALRSTIEWSHQLLTDAERTLFARLSVLSGPSGLDAIEAVAGPARDDDLLGMLGSLVDKSLVSRQLVEGELRFRMLEVIRQFARERLDEIDAEQSVDRAHAMWCWSLAREAKTNADSAPWFDRLDLELDNVRAALHWASTSGERSVLIGLCVDLGTFWQTRGHLDEGQRWLDRALAEPQSDAEHRTLMLHHACSVAIRRGEYQRAVDLGRELLELARVRADEDAIVRSLAGLAVAAGHVGSLELALEFGAEAVKLARRLGRGRIMPTALSALADLELRRGCHRRGLELHQESLEFARVHGEPVQVAWATSNLGLAKVLCGDLDGAENVFDQARELARRLGDRELTGVCFVGKAAVASRAGRVVDAARWQAGADLLLGAIGAEMEHNERALHDQTASVIASSLDRLQLAVAGDEGRSLVVAEAISHRIPSPDRP